MHFPPTNKSHKIFNHNTVKVNYSCTQNILQIIKGHNKELTQVKQLHQFECNCCNKTKCPLNGICHKEDVIYKCTVLTTFQPKKVYFGFAKAELKKQRYSHTQSFHNENYSNSTTLSKYVWKKKKTKKETATLKWEIIQTAAPYTNKTKPYSLFLQEKLAILMHQN